MCPSLSSGASRVDSRRELFDLALRGVELADAETVELLAAFPELQRLVEGRLAALEPLDDLGQLLLTSVVERTSRSSRRTIA